MMRRALAIVLVTVMSGCLCGGGAIARYGLAIDVRAADSGTPVANAIVTVHDGDYMEILHQLGSSYYGAAERPGVYRIEVESPDFASAVRTGVEVDDGACGHVDTTHVEIELSPP